MLSKGGREIVCWVVREGKVRGQGRYLGWRDGGFAYEARRYDSWHDLDDAEHHAREYGGRVVAIVKKRRTRASVLTAIAELRARVEGERRNANEWLAKAHDAEKARDAALAELAEVRRLLEMDRHSAQRCPGDISTIKRLEAELEATELKLGSAEKRADMLNEQLARQCELLLATEGAVAAEREACAKLADKFADESTFGLTGYDHTAARIERLAGKYIARSIRARGQAKP